MLAANYLSMCYEDGRKIPRLVGLIACNCLTDAKVLQGRKQALTPNDNIHPRELFVNTKYYSTSQSPARIRDAAHAVYLLCDSSGYVLWRDRGSIDCLPGGPAISRRETWRRLSAPLWDWGAARKFLGNE